MSRGKWQTELESEIAALEQDLCQWFASYDEALRGYVIRQLVYHLEERTGRSRTSKDLRQQLEHYKPGSAKEVAEKKAELYRKVLALAQRVTEDASAIDPEFLAERIILPSIIAWCHMQSIEIQIDDIKKKGGFNLKAVAVVAGGVTLATIIINKIIKNVKERKQKQEE